MRSHDRHNPIDQGHRYNPLRFPILEAREALNLPAGASPREAGDALESLITKAKRLPLGDEQRGNLAAAEKAFIRGDRRELFSPAELEAASESELQAGVIKAIKELWLAVRRIEAFPRYHSREMPGSPAEPLSQDRGAAASGGGSPTAVPALPINPPIAFIRGYLRENGVISPDAQPDREPCEPLRAQLGAHGLRWMWNQTTSSWDPARQDCSNTFFRAGPPYFSAVFSKVARGRTAPLTAPAHALAVECLKISRDRVRSSGDANNPPAEAVLARQHRALYVFLRATAPRNPDPHATGRARPQE